ncbi:cubilin-like [Saccostrea echinata]|uniref:cubilin-like n=1 Tax=Saccostrea echinata TaxID=191078 RepID=UPI002A81AED1|nr:cubilin-like [Saccostrea echinata]
MANQHERNLQVVILISYFLPLECVTSLSCGSSVNAITLNQSIETFKYPASGIYPTLTGCQWLFNTSDAEARLIFEVTSIYVDCGDTLKFYDGSSSSASTFGNSICCSSQSSCGSAKLPETTTGNSLFVDFLSDRTDNSYETGFTFTVVVGKDESNCSNSGAVHNIALTEQIRLTSPEFPATYPPNHNCTYTYIYTGGYVKLEFIYLRVEGVNGACYDFIEIFNGSSTSSPLIAKVCGDTIPTETHTSSDTSLTIRFYSDYQENKKGFLAYVAPVADNKGTSVVMDTTTTELPTSEQSKTSILPTSEQSQTSILPTSEQSQTSILPTSVQSQTSILPTSEQSQTSILPTSVQSQTSRLSTSEQSQTSTLSTAKPTLTSTSDIVLQSLDKFKGPFISGSVVLSLIIITILVFICSRNRTSQHKSKENKVKGVDLQNLFGGQHAIDPRPHIWTYEGFTFYSHKNEN